MTDNNDACQQFPAEEGPVKDEQVPFAAVHHFFGKLERTLGGDVRILRKDVRHHAVFVVFYNTRNDEEQTPEENVKIADFVQSLDGERVKKLLDKRIETEVKTKVPVKPMYLAERVPVKPLHPEKAYSPMVIIVSGKVRFSKLEQ